MRGMNTAVRVESCRLLGVLSGLLLTCACAGPSRPGAQSGTPKLVAESETPLDTQPQAPVDPEQSTTDQHSAPQPVQPTQPDAQLTTTASPTAAPSTPKQPLPEPTCPCQESAETYMAKGRRLSAAEDWAGAYVAFKSAAAVTSQPFPEAAASAAHAAHRAGHADVATELNRHAFIDAAGDDELQATIAFNQGLVERQRGATLRAALLFDRSLSLREHPAARRMASGLPNAETTCQRPTTIAELCECNAQAAGKEADLLSPEVNTCRILRETPDRRFLVVYHVSVTSNSFLIPTELLLAERIGGRLHVHRYLEQVNAGSQARSDAELVAINKRRIHGRSLLTVRTRAIDTIKGNGGMEYLALTVTRELFCTLKSVPADCRGPLELRMEETTTQIVYKPRGDGGVWDDELVSSDFIEYGYSIAADGWLRPSKQGGDLPWHHTPQPLRLW